MQKLKEKMSFVPFCEEVLGRRKRFASCSPSRSPFWGKPNVELSLFLLLQADVPRLWWLWWPRDGTGRCPWSLMGSRYLLCPSPLETPK